MRAGRPGRDPELGSDLLGRETEREQAHDLTLTTCQLDRPRGTLRRSRTFVLRSPLTVASIDVPESHSGPFDVKSLLL